MSAEYQEPASVQEIERVMLETLEKAGTPPEYIYAFRKTGRIVTRENAAQLTAEELDEWDDAVDEYRAGMVKP